MRTRRRHLTLGALAAISATLIGCATTPAPAPLADVVSRDAQLTTLSKLIADAGLADTLRQPGPFTLFAPSDEAFRALPAKTLSDLAADKGLLNSVLTYHVLPVKAMAADVKNGNVKTVQGANLALSKAGTFVTVEDAVVQRPDVPATNGVIHVIDKVLMPPKR